MTRSSKEPPKPDWALTGRERKAQAARAEGRRGPRRRWPWVVLGLAGLGAGLWVAADRGLIGTPPTEETESAAPEAETEAEPPRREVVMQLLPSELATVARGPLRETLRLTGSLDPARQLGIPAEVAGRVDSVEKRAGEPAATGEVLVRIDIETLRNQVEQSRATADATRAQLEFARAQLERTQSLVNRGVATSSTLDSDQANVQQLQANLHALETQVATTEKSLEKATITAPFDGMISARNVDPGAYVSPGTALMTLVDISTLELEGAVPVFYAPRIRIGQGVEISVDGFGDRSFAGNVERIAPVAATGTRILPIYATIDNPQGELRGGMFASGVLVLDSKDGAIGIPADALRRDDAGDFVLKRDGDRVIRQPVTVARMWDRGRKAEIAAGLAEGDVIVAAPLERLQPDTKITVVGD
ncbi:efflux RND transporter periplasmic adaptor subunit [Pseudooceanicola aestuarii]|uniref:efflux RND transporter periplasmic adaptor subunit n=1 Tax=Pseudooceanicola aestuarii TaxID=2697319 RepID=UPI0013D0F9A3|nr:efflux RND transporter periplasmic adaptor subunit [Pseudooceanicola aestuarii]